MGELLFNTPDLFAMVDGIDVLLTSPKARTVSFSWENIVSEDNMSLLPDIKKVVFNNPATIVIWEDGNKTVVKCQNGDTFTKETGLAMAIAKKAYGNNGRYNDVMKKWCE